MKLFPIMDVGSYRFRDNIEVFRANGVMTVMIAIPWDMIQPHEKQAYLNHSQSLERLAQRGGLAACEAIAVLEGTDCFSRRSSESADLRKLSQLVNEWLTSVASPLLNPARPTSSDS